MRPLSGETILERRWLLFVLLALLVRALYITIAIADIRSEGTPGHLSIDGGDTYGYLAPIESVLNGGEYEPAYRMPGVGAPYWILRQFLDIGNARDVLVGLQWLLSGFSVYVLALIALRFSGSVRAALLVYGAFLVSAYSSWYDAIIISDSFAVSSLILGTFFLQQALDRDSWTYMLACGAMVAWSIFLRPVSAGLLLPALFVLFRYSSKGRRLSNAVIFLAPFLVLDSAWTIRNLRASGEFRPLTNQGLMPADFSSQIHAHVMTFLQGYGGNYIWWAPGSDMRWFGVWKGGGDLDNEGRDAKAPPPYAVAPGYTMDSLVLLSERIRTVYSGRLTPTDSVVETARIISTLDRYSELYKKGSPFNYHVLSRLRMLKNVTWQHGTEGMIVHPFGGLSWPLKLFKVTQSVLYIFTYTLGTWGMILLLLNWRRAHSALHLWLPLATAYMILVYPIVLRMCEWRYMVHQFPFALLIAVVWTYQFLHRSSKVQSGTPTGHDQQLKPRSPRA